MRRWLLLLGRRLCMLLLLPTILVKLLMWWTPCNVGDDHIHQRVGGCRGGRGGAEDGERAIAVEQTTRDRVKEGVTKGLKKLFGG